MNLNTVRPELVEGPILSLVEGWCAGGRAVTGVPTLRQAQGRCFDKLSPNGFVRRMPTFVVNQD